jgi:hypothetical protein
MMELIIAIRLPPRLIMRMRREKIKKLKLELEAISIITKVISIRFQIMMVRK